MRYNDPENLPDSYGTGKHPLTFAAQKRIGTPNRQKGTLMEKLTDATRSLMTERFGHDSIIALATAEADIPYVRNVNAYYEDGAFYVITHGLSNKMRQISVNPSVAVSGDWFTAHGQGTDLGYFGKPENAEIAGKLKSAFAAWIDNGHNNFEDRNTCILRIRLTDGILFSHGTRYDIDFSCV